MAAIRNYCQHVLNPLHLFCRLRQAGMSSPSARRVCHLYEQGLYRFILQ